ncbi:hypothetical protein ACFV2X_04905 [Streptomyces sp. NPDC059679]|uniref:hypothetical protein n=1 Tax=Streptomyces sp. NPDC059679 TaxID=3346903 RepID=UPI0036B2DEB6
MSITAKIAATVAGSVLVLSAAIVPAAASSSTVAGPVQGAWVQGAWLTGLPGTTANVAADVPACC